MENIKKLIFIFNFLIFGAAVPVCLYSTEVDSETGLESEFNMSFEDLENCPKKVPEEPELIKLINAGDTNGVIQAINKGADVNSKSNSGKPAIKLAMDKHLFDIVRFLSAKGAKIDKSLGSNVEFKKTIKSEFNFPIHNLIMLFDNSEVFSKKINTPVVNQFFIAQYQKVCPIVLSGNTLRLSIKILSEFKKGNINDDDLKGLFHIAELSDSEWYFYKVKKDDIYLLIPKDYLKIALEQCDSCEFTKTLPKSLSKEEVVTGFLINNTDILEKVGIETIKKTSLGSEVVKNNKINIDDLKSIFVNREYLSKIVKESIPFQKNKILNNLIGAWNIYLVGHGSYSKDYLKSFESGLEQNEEGVVITGLDIDQFKELIRFFDLSINVNFLYYLSCYAGGYNIMLPYLYRESTKVVKQQFPKFTVVVASITDAVAKTQKLFSTGEISKLKKIDFDCFFNALKNNLNRGSVNPTLYNDKSIEDILFCVVSKDIDPITISSYPQIMLPGTGIFKVLSHEKIQEITDEFIDKNLGKSLEVRDKGAVLVRSTDIINKLKILSGSGTRKASEQVPMIISIIPGVSLHKFGQVEAEKIKFLDFFHKAMFSIKPAFPKYFYFKKLILEDSSAKLTLSNVFIKVQSGSLSAAFINGCKVYFDGNLSRSLSGVKSLKDLINNNGLVADDFEGIYDYLNDPEISKIFASTIIEKLLNFPKASKALSHEKQQQGVYEHVYHV